MKSAVHLCCSPFFSPAVHLCDGQKFTVLLYAVLNVLFSLLISSSAVLLLCCTRFFIPFSGILLYCIPVLSSSLSSTLQSYSAAFLAVFLSLLSSSLMSSSLLSSLLCSSLMSSSLLPSSLLSLFLLTFSWQFCTIFSELNLDVRTSQNFVYRVCATRFWKADLVSIDRS